MAITVNADDGVLLPLEDLPQVLAYNVDDTLNYIQVTYRGNTYRQTLSYTGALVTGVSRWEVQ